MRLGADPEVFFHQDGKFRSAINRIGGTKTAPLSTRLGVFQEDNVAGEFNILPQETKMGFVAAIQESLQGISEFVRLPYSKAAFADFPLDELQDPSAWIAGCDPDFNAWQWGAKNEKPDISTSTFRSAGGHVHVELQDWNPYNKMLFVRMLDLTLGVPSVLLDPDQNRKKLYGKAGAFRFKPYGIEYRVLSNFWIFDPQLCEWVFDGCKYALDNFERLQPLVTEEEVPIEECVSTNNKELARALITLYNIPIIDTVCRVSGDIPCA